MLNGLRLSLTSTTMLQEVMEEVKNYNLTSVNLPVLLFGVVDAYEGDEESNPLQEYILSAYKELDQTDIEDVLSDMVTECCTPKKAEGEETPKEQENQSVWTFIDFEGKELCVTVNDDVNTIFNELADIMVKNEDLTEVTILHFIMAMFNSDNSLFKKFFEELDISYKKAKKYFEKVKLGNSIPFKLASFMSILNDKIDASKPCEILKRDKEVERLWNIMLKKNKRNAVIVGEAGVGKTALVEKITYDINRGNCPQEFKNFRVISLDVNALIAGSKWRGDAEQRIKDLIEFLEENQDVILFIDEVHTILGAGACVEGEMDLANALKPILARGDTIVIGATTNKEYEKYFKKDAALSRRFKMVKVEEPLNREIYPMIKNKIKALSEYHGVTIRKAMIEYTIMIASCFAFEQKNPDKTLDLIDMAMVTAKRSGKKEVSKNCVLKNFAIFFEMWNNMSEMTKRATAYHEAGHYIVGKASGRLSNYNWLAISIMPAEDYLGVTVYEEDREKVPFTDISYFTDDIAFDLGGRAGESAYTGLYTSGASQDLDTATRRAHQVITKLGMGSSSVENRIFLNTEEYPMFSEKAKNEINQRVNDLIKQAYERAEKIIEKNKDILEAIVEALMQKHIMSEKELDKIWKDTVSKRNK